MLRIEHVAGTYNVSCISIIETLLYNKSSSSPSHHIASLRFASLCHVRHPSLPHPGPTSAPGGRDLGPHVTFCVIFASHRIASHRIPNVTMRLCENAYLEGELEYAYYCYYPSASDHLRRIGQSFCIGCDIMIDFSSRTQCSKDKLSTFIL